MNSILAQPLFEAASFDRSFVGSVRDSFNTVGVDSRMLYYILLVLIAAGVLYLVGKFVEVLRRRCRRDALPAYMIVKKSVIMDVMQQALEERSKFEMKFLPSEYTRPVAVCSLEELDASSLTFDLGPDLKATRSWINRMTEFYFRVQGGKKQHVYYRFASPIVGVRRLTNNVNCIVVEFPETIELQQKRAHLRIEPPSQYLLGAAIWQEKGEEKPALVKKWGKPHLVFQPGKAVNPFSIEDLSAGGLRLMVTRAALRENNFNVGVGQRLYLILDLYDPETSRKRRFWLLCRVQHVYEDFETRNAEFGLQFVLHGRLKKENDEEAALQVEWKPVTNEGVELLGGWIMKRHLELYRDKGIV